MTGQDERTSRRVSRALIMIMCLGIVLTGQLSARDLPPDQQAIRDLLSRVEDRGQRRMLTERVRSGELQLQDVGDRILPVAARSSDWRDKASPASTGPLGASLSSGKSSTTFRVFSPRALKAEVWVYDEPTGGTPERHSMTRNGDGVWVASVSGVGAGSYYEFYVDGPVGPGELFNFTRPLSDPYAKANVHSGGRSIVIDDSFDWGKTTDFRAPLPRDAIVYEMHVKDFTQHPSSGVSAASARGKYLGLTRGAGTDRVLGHLEQLNVNVVELLPVHEFDNKAAPEGHINHWGYMTTHFFAPETSFASAADGAAVGELKQAVKALHEKEIAVVLDVVFNHTAEGNEEGPVFNFKGLDNKLFYRLTPDFFYWNGTGTGNEFASEREPVRKLIVDSCKYWMEEYRVDGFRFDLGASLDKETLIAVREALPSGTMLFAEPWTADWGRRKWDKGDMRGQSWSLWNDGFRENVKALIHGKSRRNDLMTAISGSCITFAARPAESLNYVEAHDGYTLEDAVLGDVAKNHLAATALLTSQGIPMLHEGQEFRKSKQGNHNSYDQDNETNWIDWTVKEKNRASFDFYAGLIEMRRRFAAFRSQECLSNSTVRWLRPVNEQGLGYLLKGPGADPDFLVLLNGHTSESITFGLPSEGEWEVISNGHQVAFDGSLGSASGSYRVSSTKGVILKSPGNVSWP